MSESQSHNDFLATIVHQLRAPLSTVRMAHEQLLENTEGSLSRRELHILEQSKSRVDYCLELVSSILQPEIINHLTRVPELQPVAVELLIDEVIDSLSFPINHKQLTVVKQYAARPVAIDLDQEQFRVVLDNLIENAVKYTPYGGHITVQTLYDENTLTFVVSDSGPGLPPGGEGDAFEKFTTFVKEPGGLRDGSGLGLYIANNIIQRHGGSIVYTANRPTGAVFSVCVPIKSKISK